MAIALIIILIALVEDLVARNLELEQEREIWNNTERTTEESIQASREEKDYVRYERYSTFDRAAYGFSSNNTLES